MQEIIKNVDGWCPCCKQNTKFISKSYWLRDFYLCSHCGSIPRQRGIMKILNERFPNYHSLKIHESSPDGATFYIMRNECENYSFSYFYPDVELGEGLECGGTNQNLENMTFADETFDIFITQDVMEHINSPEKAFREIKRVLKPNGIHIFTTPLYPFQKTQARVEIDENGEVKFILPPMYHGNPIDKDGGSLVTYDWGYDIVEFIKKCSGMDTEVIQFFQSEENYKQGLEADFLQILISYN